MPPSVDRRTMQCAWLTFSDARQRRLYDDQEIQQALSQPFHLNPIRIGVVIRHGRDELSIRGEYKRINVAMMREWPNNISCLQVPYEYLILCAQSHSCLH